VVQENRGCGALFRRNLPDDEAAQPLGYSQNFRGRVVDAVLNFFEKRIETRDDAGTSTKPASRRSTH
jgi:hypothetical protein